MTRRMSRKSASSSSRPPPTPSAAQTPTRRSTRTAATKVTPTKSAYFSSQKPSLKDESTSESDKLSEAPGDESAYDEEIEDQHSESDSTLDDHTSEEDSQSKKRKAGPNSGRASAKSTPKRRKGQELWREGVKTGHAPGTQVVIKKPKARDPGKTPYKPHTIHPNTLLFLADLKENNDREWLKMHDPDYRASLKDWNEFVECLTSKVTEIDETVPELPNKDIVFRIYRDIRFSPDPTPYKTHFSAAWSRTGRKGPYAAYYLQIAPGRSFLGGGLWMPEAQSLAAVRRNIDRRPHMIKSVLKDESLRKHILRVKSEDDEEIVKAFAAQNANAALKTKPKGYDADHRDIELLRLRNFTLGTALEDKSVTGAQGLEYVSRLLSYLLPFAVESFYTKTLVYQTYEALGFRGVRQITYLNDVVMPDDPQESSGSSESDDDNDDAGGQ